VTVREERMSIRKKNSQWKKGETIIMTQPEKKQRDDKGFAF
jgi:hypothetical protein